MAANPSTPNRVALITGGAIRVGRAVALRMAEGGYDLAITYLSNQKPAEELLDQVRSIGRAAIAVQANFLEPESACDAVFRQIAEKFGRLDLLVNNASIYEPDAPPQAAIDQIRRFCAIHVESPTLLTRAFAPMLKAAGGLVVNMLDLNAQRPIPRYLNYCASKAGLLNLTLGFARELAPEVRVNGIAPGVVEWANGITPDERQKYLRRVPLARPGTPTDVAEAIYFLAATGSYITGHILPIDGGRSIT
jgi:pteridine reductase